MKRSFITIAALMIVTVSPPFVGTADAFRFPRFPRICVIFEETVIEPASGFCFALFDNEARLSADGRTITASGTLPPCERNEQKVRISAAFVQQSIPTAAQGEARRACRSGTRRTRFTVLATVPPGKPALVAGQPVEACAVAFTRGAAGQVLDIKHWCSFPTLVTE